MRLSGLLSCVDEQRVCLQRSQAVNSSSSPMASPPWHVQITSLTGGVRSNWVWRCRLQHATCALQHGVCRLPAHQLKVPVLSRPTHGIAIRGPIRQETARGAGQGMQDHMALPARSRTTQQAVSPTQCAAVPSVSVRACAPSSLCVPGLRCIRAPHPAIARPLTPRQNPRLAFTHRSVDGQHVPARNGRLNNAVLEAALHQRV